MLPWEFWFLVMASRSASLTQSEEDLLKWSIKEPHPNRDRGLDGLPKAQNP